MFYKLLHDTLFILLFIFILAMIAEGLLPGIVSSRMVFPALLLLLAGNLFAMHRVSLITKLPVPRYEIKKKTLFLFLSLLLLLIINSVLKTHIFITIAITFSVAMGGYYLHRMIEEEVRRKEKS